MKTAKFIKKIGGTPGDARVYQLSEPAVAPGPLSKVDFVYVSAAIVDNPLADLCATFDERYGPGAETYIFPCDSQGAVISWQEMKGSTRGVLSHEIALANLGYEIA